MASRHQTKSRFGHIRRLPSARYQVLYTLPDGRQVTAPRTFVSKIDAEGWRAAEERYVTLAGSSWVSPKEREAAELATAEQQRARLTTFGDWSEHHLKHRLVRGRPLEESTLRLYRILLRRYILPNLGALPLTGIDAGIVSGWYAGLPADKVKTRRECYALAKAIYVSAVASDGPIPGYPMPFTIRGAGTGSSPKRESTASSTEIAIILNTIRPEWRLMVLLGLWCGMRFSEIAELRATDVDLAAGRIKIRRAVGRGSHGSYTKAPKSAAGSRDQRVPSTVLGELRDHLTAPCQESDLLFTSPRGLRLQWDTFNDCRGGWIEARSAAERPDLRFHDLRATGATLLARNGATVAEVQDFLGDSTPSAALRYIRSTSERMDALTDQLDSMATSADW